MQSPPRPEGDTSNNLVSEELWNIMNRCWSIEPARRPTMEQVHSHFLLNVDTVM